MVGKIVEDDSQKDLMSSGDSSSLNSSYKTARIQTQQQQQLERFRQQQLQQQMIKQQQQQQQIQHKQFQPPNKAASLATWNSPQMNRTNGVNEHKASTRNVQFMSQSNTRNVNVSTMENIKPDLDACESSSTSDTLPAANPNKIHSISSNQYVAGGGGGGGGYTMPLAFPSSFSHHLATLSDDQQKYLLQQQQILILALAATEQRSGGHHHQPKTTSFLPFPQQIANYPYASQSANQKPIENFVQNESQAFVAPALPPPPPPPPPSSSSSSAYQNQNKPNVFVNNNARSSHFNQISYTINQISNTRDHSNRQQLQFHANAGQNQTHSLSSYQHQPQQQQQQQQQFVPNHTVPSRVQLSLSSAISQAQREQRHSFSTPYQILPLPPSHELMQNCVANAMANEDNIKFWSSKQNYKKPR